MKEHLLLRGPSQFLPLCLSVVLLTFVMAGCRPDLPTPGSNPLANLQPAELVVTLEPEAPLTAAPRVMRARVHWPGSIDAARVFLVRGEVTDHHLRQIERDELTKTLMERIVPVVVWAEDEENIVVAPTVVLEQGQTYAIASGDPRKVVHFDVRTEGELPLLTRVWPPIDTPARFGIFCGATVLPDVEVDVTLEPGGLLGTLSRGVAAHGPGPNCMRFRIKGRWPAEESGPMVLPPVVEIPGLGGGLVQIEPMAFETGELVEEEIAPLECERGEMRFGLGCADVMDDRAIVRAPAGELLWGVEGEGIDWVAKVGSKERFVIKGLPPERDIALDVVTIDRLGRAHRESFTATTNPLMAHVVLNEVMANPIGPEPHQEWVELYNDGQADAALSGYRILDIGGETVLPEALLPPGQFAVVVNEKFVADDEIDVAPDPSAIVVRVPSLGRSGLSNSGELLRLVHPEGYTISRFPALPKPKAGQSVSRRTPSAPDGVSSSFLISEPTPGLPNAVMADP